MRNRIREILEGYQPPVSDARDLMPAAVMLLLHERDGVEHMLFQVRTQHVEHHKGEISLPGGGRDHEDVDLLATALRETEEELGVSAEHIEVFGQLADQPTRSRFSMTPFVGAITAPGPYPFRFAPAEVDQLLEVPLTRLLSGEAREWTPSFGGGLMPAFRQDEHLIFGATARVIDNFLRLLEERGGLGETPSTPAAVRFA
jgi:8-oxo-dGTP pyrophosphatase MutT (NUDIX family)